MEVQLYTYQALVKDIHDGDTVGLDVDLGFGLFLLTMNPISDQRELTCRFFGINAPELRTDAGKESLAYLESVLPIGALVIVTSHSWDKYGGRFDGTIVYNDVNINELMVSSGHAVAYP